MTQWIKPSTVYQCRQYTTTRSHSSLPLIYIPSSSVYHFGDAPTVSQAAGSAKRPIPVIKDLQWTVHDDEAWAIVSSGGGGGSGKDTVFKTLLGHLRLFPPPPPPGGLFPLLSLLSKDSHPSPTTPRDPYTSISLVSFRHRSGGPGGAFYDFTARYGAVWDDEQRVTLLESMFPHFLEMRKQKEGKFEWQREGDRRQVALDTERVDEAVLTGEEERLFRELVERTGLTPLLNIPMVALSNGQMRRARIVKAVLKKPELLLLDEPLTGLDVENRFKILELLKELHAAKKPRIIMGLRVQDEIPDWITHIAFADKGKVQVGGREEILSSIQQHATTEHSNTTQVNRPAVRNQGSEGRVVVAIEGANVQYAKRKVLNNISWTIRLGERWHLKGANGSGKSTLLSLVTGVHPLSYSLPRLELFGQKRYRTPTPLIQSRVGEMSPEMFDAFPRRMPGMSVWAVVGTGFEGAFIERGTEGVGVPMSDGGLGVGIREEGENELTWGGVKGESWEAVKEWRIKRCWEVLESLGPAAWDSHDKSFPTSQGVSLVTKEFARRRFTELSAGEQRVVLVMRALVGRPPLVLLDEALSGMSDGMVRAVRHYVSGGGVGSDQALIAISHWQEELPFAEPVKVFELREGARAGVE